jgi:hypothetical protein
LIPLAILNILLTGGIYSHQGHFEAMSSTMHTRADR